ncbi:MAG: hypothetical protein SAL70_19695 [Scytonema sp. PMC 1070.18]|nr:hypothetical protein [Scytonema sp. PMC 1070.18]
MYDLTKMSLVNMCECGLALRHLCNSANSMEDVSNRIIQYFYENFIDKLSGEKSCVLVRFFKTHSYGKLTPELQEYARQVLGNDVVSDSLKCLTLLATAGKLPEWNSRHQSKGHQVIPLSSEKVISRIPMIYQLIHQFGLNPSNIITQPDPHLLYDLEQRIYNVFYVSDALDSPFIPSQNSFVIPFRIKSVIGFGGVLPSGNMFAIVMFLKVRVPKFVVDLFPSLALNIKMIVVPFDNESIFNEQCQASVNSSITTTTNKDEILHINSKIGTLTKLLDVELKEIENKIQQMEAHLNQSDSFHQSNNGNHKKNLGESGLS